MKTTRLRAGLVTVLGVLVLAGVGEAQARRVVVNGA